VIGVRGVRGGHTFRAPQVVVFEIDGRQVREARFIHQDQAAYDAFWS